MCFKNTRHIQKVSKGAEFPTAGEVLFVVMLATLSQTSSLCYQIVNGVDPVSPVISFGREILRSRFIMR